jgi:hypothetical protein
MSLSLCRYALDGESVLRERNDVGFGAGLRVDVRKLRLQSLWTKRNTKVPR